MARRKYTYCDKGETFTQYGYTYNKPCERVSCPVCEPVICYNLTPRGEPMRPHKDFLRPGMPLAKWLRECNPYRGWSLWRNPKPKTPWHLIPVETVAETHARLISYSPPGYTWKLWHQHKGALRPRIREAA